MNFMKDSMIVQTIMEFYPNVQAVYLFRFYGTENERKDSDVDIALLFSHHDYKETKNLIMSRCRYKLEKLIGKDVDLINLRQVSTVLQKEIAAYGRLLYCADRYALDEFEMLTLSYYQKLNEERKEILTSFYETRRAYKV